MTKEVVLVESTHVKPIAPLLKEYGLVLVEKNPKLVISHGGDGTILQSEYFWPGVPKLALRGSAICKMCSPLSNEKILDALVAGQLKTKKFSKLEVAVGGKKLLALNDVVVHNYQPRHAIRYELFIDGRQIGKEIIGDGIVVSTPFGATGYYRSITDSIFEVGIGLAFNNSTEPADHMVIDEARTITMRLTRGEGCIYADNQDELILVKPGEEIVIKQAKQSATFLVTD